MHLNVFQFCELLFLLFFVSLCFWRFSVAYFCSILFYNTFAMFLPLRSLLLPCLSLSLTAVYFAALKCCSRHILLHKHTNTHTYSSAVLAEGLVYLVFVKNQIFLCRRANKMALPSRGKHKQNKSRSKKSAAYLFALEVKQKRVCLFCKPNTRYPCKHFANFQHAGD